MVEKWHIAASFRNMAREYYCAEAALPERRFNHVHAFLLCRSLELVLKAFLSANGETIKNLKGRDVGHKLQVILRKCEAAGLGRSFSDVPTLREQVKLVDQYYSAKQYEYSEKGCVELPKLTVLRELVSKLLTLTKSLCV